MRAPRPISAGTAAQTDALLAKAQQQAAVCACAFCASNRDAVHKAVLQLLNVQEGVGGDSDGSASHEGERSE